MCLCFIFSHAQGTLRDELTEYYRKYVLLPSSKISYVDMLSSSFLEVDREDNILADYDNGDKKQIAYELVLMYIDAALVDDYTTVTYPYLIGKVEASNVRKYTQGVKLFDNTMQLVETYMNTYEAENNLYTNSVFSILEESDSLRDLTYKAPAEYIWKIQPFVDMCCEIYKTSYKQVILDCSVEKVGQTEHDKVMKALQYIERNDKVRLTNYYYKIWPDINVIDDIVLAMETKMNVVNAIIVQNTENIRKDIISRFLSWCFSEKRISVAANRAKTNPSKKLPLPTNTGGGNNTMSNEVFEIVEKQPEYNGGMDGLMTFLSQNLKYPTIAQEMGIQGRLIVSFVIDKDGSISQTEMKIYQTAQRHLDEADMLESMADNPTTLERVRSIREGVKALEQEAKRVVSIMPKWKPGMQKGKPVRVRFTLPITFRLQ